MAEDKKLNVQWQSPSKTGEPSNESDLPTENGSGADKPFFERITEFGFALVISIGVPCIPIVVSRITGALDPAIWMQSICIYLFLIAATARVKFFRYLAIVGGICATFVYAGIEGGIENIETNVNSWLLGFQIFSAGLTVSHVIDAWTHQMKHGRAAVEGGK